MPYSISTKDGITINNIPDDIDPNSPELRARVAQERVKRSGGIDQNAMVNSENQPRSEGGRDLLDVIGGYGETALTMGTGAIAEPFAGLAAIGGMPFGVDPSEVVEGVREGMTYQPRTEAGQAYLGNVGEVLAPVGEKLMDASQYLGDKTFDLTGSPAAAAAAYSAPTAILELLGLKGIQRLKSPVKLKTRDIGGNWAATPELENMLRERGLIFDQLDPKAKAAIPEVLDPKLLGQTQKSKTQPAFVEQLAAGGRENALAPYVLEAGKAIKDPLAAAAIKQGFDEGLVQAIKTTTPATRFNMMRMLSQMERIKGNMSAAGDMRPIDIAGQSLAQRVKFLDAQRKNDVLRLRNLSKKELEGVPIQSAKVGDNLGNLLRDEFGVEIYDSKGNFAPDYTATDLARNVDAQKTISEVVDILQEFGKADAQSAHQVKRILDQYIDYKKSNKVGQMTPAEQRILKSVRKSLNDVIREVSPEYAAINDRLSTTIGALENLQDATKVDILGGSADAALGQEARKLLTNYKSRVPMSEAIKEIDNLVAQYGGDFPDNLYDQVMFASNIDEMFGAAARDSFKGTMQQAMKGSPIITRGLTGAAGGGTTGAATGIASELLTSGYDKLRGVNQQEAFKAMRELLRGKY